MKWAWPCRFLQKVPVCTALLPLLAPFWLLAQRYEVPASDRMSVVVAYMFSPAESSGGYLYRGYFLPDAQLNC